MIVNHVVLVDEKDREIGTMEKMEAHRKGILHRAFSAFVFNSKGELLLQQRAHGKYHSGGLWTNTCCSHPRLGESVESAAKRRLKEEMGISCTFKHKFSFMYRTSFPNYLIENELDHVLFGFSDDIPVPDPTEVANWRYVSLDSLHDEIEQDEDRFTIWFKMCLERVSSMHASAILV